MFLFRSVLKSAFIFGTFISSFTTFAQPTITSFSPKYGEAGDAVTITGTNFNTTKTNNIVRLGGMKCSVTNATSTSLTVVLPEQIRSDYFWVTNTSTKLIGQSFTRFKVGFTASSYSYSTSNFQTPVTFNVGGMMLANRLGKNRIGLADLDDDGDLDFIRWETSNKNLDFWKNNNTGSISSSSLTKTTLISNYESFNNTLLYDVDGDGRLDIFGAKDGSSTNTSVFVWNNSSTTFSVNSTPTAASMTYTDRTPQISDINLDGKLDYGSCYSWSAYFRENKSTSSTISFATKSNSPPSGDHDLLLPIDINLDKKMDYVAFAYNADPAYCINQTTKGNSATNFSFSTYSTLSTNNGSNTKPRGGVAADLNNDDKEDLIVHSGSNSGIHIFRNTSTNSSSYGFASRYTLSTTSGVYDLTVADMNNDGWLDLIYSDGVVLKYLRNTTSSVGGTLSFASPITLVTSLGSSGPQIEVFDFDQDGDFDIMAMISSTNLKVYENNLVSSSTISSTASLSVFNACTNSVSASQTFTVSGTGLTANLTVSAPTAFEVSTSASSGYSSSISLTPTSGSVASTTIYVRLSSGNTSGSKSGNITLSSTGAASQTISISGTVNSAAFITGTLSGFISETSQLTGTGTAATSNAWVSGTPANVTVSSGGLLSFVASGNSVVTYTDNNGCTASATAISKNNIMYVVNENNSLHNLSNWSNNSGGTGENPSSFSNTFKFYVYNSNIFANSFSISGDWEVSGELYIPSFATLTIGTGKKLTVSGTLTNDGTISGTGQNDTLLINGNSNRTISGTVNIGTFIADMASNSITHSGVMNVYNEFSVPNISGYSKSGSGAINLKGSSNYTARLGKMDSDFNMEINCEFYIPAGYRKFRFLGHPFNSAIGLSQLIDDIDITGNGGSSNGFTNTSTNNPSAFWFDTDNGSGAQMDDGWTAFTSTTAGSTGTGNAWDIGEGIIVMIRGSKGEGLNGQSYTPSAVTVDFSGKPQIGNTTVTLATSGSGAATGFNLVANPYASPVDISNVIHGGGSANRLNKTIYTRDPQSGSYKSKLTQSGSNFVLPAYTAFWVKATGTGSNPTVQFTENDKKASSTLVVRSETDIPNDFIEFEAFHDGQAIDELHFHFSSENSSKYEELHDAFKLKNDGFNMYSITQDEVPLCRDFRNFTDEVAQYIPVVFDNKNKAIDFDFTVNHQTIIDPTRKVILWDKLTDEKTEITGGVSMKIKLDPSINGSLDKDRFVLILNSKTNGMDRNLGVPHPIVSPNPFVNTIHIKDARNSRIRLFGANGTMIEDRYNSGDFDFQIDAKDLNSGVYLIQVQNEQATHQFKVVK